MYNFGRWFVFHVSPLWDIGLIFLIWNFPKEVFFLCFVHATTNYESVNASFFLFVLGKSWRTPKKASQKL